MLPYLVWGMGYGFAAALQPGPFQSYLVAQTLRVGVRRALPAAFAPLLSDGPIILLVLSALSRIPPWWLQVLRFAGGAFVLFLAAGTLRAWRAYGQRPGAAASPPPRQTMLRAAAVNLLNPGPYLFWSLVTGPLLLAGWQAAPLNGLALLVGFYGTLLLTSLGLLVLCAGAGRIAPRVNRGLLGLSGLALAGFGAWQVCSGLLAWRGGA
jgi:threonine/homoserine/homoserine lactone efflux protein